MATYSWAMLRRTAAAALQEERAAVEFAAKMRADAAELRRLLADKEGQLAALREKNQATLDSPKLPPVSARDSNVSRSVPDRFPPSRQPQSARVAGEGTYTDWGDMSEPHIFEFRGIMYRVIPDGVFLSMAHYIKTKLRPLNPAVFNKATVFFRQPCFTQYRVISTEYQTFHRNDA